jgi:hypothetical protein
MNLRLARLLAQIATAGHVTVENKCSGKATGAGCSYQEITSNDHFSMHNASCFVLIPKYY